MPVLRIADKPKPIPLPYIESRIPKPEELVILSKPLLDATILIGKALTNCMNKWAFGGDVAEVILGVNVQPNHIAILTSREGCDEIARNLATYQIEPASTGKREIDRDAEIQLTSPQIR